MTDREQWAKLLPVIQAYVDGKPVQCRYRAEERWSDATCMHSLRYYQWRIRPELGAPGTWARNYSQRDMNNPQVSVLSTVHYVGYENDTPDYTPPRDAKWETGWTFTPEVK